jgi:hypothetical protein
VLIGIKRLSVLIILIFLIFLKGQNLAADCKTVGKKRETFSS